MCDPGFIGDWQRDGTLHFDVVGKVTSIGGNLELLVGQSYQVKNASGSWIDADTIRPFSNTVVTIDLNAIYTVAANSFTAQGKDGYVTFTDVREASPDAFEESDVVYVVPLIEYFRDELTNRVLPVLDTGEYCLKSVTTL